MNRGLAAEEPPADWRALFVVALLIRLAYVLFYPQSAVHADAGRYDELGWSLAQGLGYHLPGGAPTVYWAPGYPAVLAALYATFGHSYVWVRVVQAILSALVPVIVGSIAFRVFDRRTAVVAAILCACYPGFIGYTGLVLTETLFTTLLAVVMYGLLSISKESSWTSVMGLGALVGVTCLCRAETVLLPLFAFVTLRLLFRDRTVAVKQWLLIYAGVVIIVAPWTARNYVVTGELIPLTVHDGDSLWISSYKEEWLELDPEREPYKSLVAGLSEVESSKVLRREGIRNIVDDPATFLWLCVKRVPRFWIGGHSNLFVGMEDSTGSYLERQRYGVFLLKLTMVGVNSLLVVLGLWGAYLSCALGKGTTRALVLLGAPIVFVAALHVVLFATLRFQIPIMPYVLMFAAVAVVRLRPVPSVYASSE